MTYGTRFFNHDTVGIYLDLDNQLVCFVVHSKLPNNRQPCVHIPLLKGQTVYPAVSLIEQGDYIEGRFGLDVPQEIVEEIENNPKGMIEVKS